MTSFWEILKASKGLSHEPFACLAAQSMAGGKVAELSGIPPLSFLSNGKPLVEYQIDGKTVQNGTPTPESPIDVWGVGDRTANLAPPLTEWVDGYVSGNGNIATPSPVNMEKSSDFLDIPDSAVSATFTREDGRFEVGSAGVWWGIGFYDSNKAFVSRETGGVAVASASVPESAKFMRVSCRTYGSDKEYMLNLGSAALPYEPYGYKIPISSNGTVAATLYLSSPLYGTGDVFDEYDSTGKIVRKWYELVLTGEETFTATMAAGHHRCHMKLVPNAIAQNATRVLSTHYRPSGGAGHGAIALTSEGTNVFFYDDTNAVTDEAFKAYLAAQYAAGTPVTVVYQLATPTEESISAPQISTVKGTNLLSVDTAVQPSNVSIKYNLK